MSTKTTKKKSQAKPRPAGDALLAEWLAKAPTVPKLRRPKDRAKIIRALDGFEEFALKDQEVDDIDVAEFGFDRLAGMLERIDELLEDLLGEPYVEWITAVPEQIQEKALFELFSQVAPTLGKGSS